MTATAGASVSTVTTRAGACRDFESVYSEHQRSLLRFAYLLCSNHHDAEDAVAAAFASTLSRWNRDVIVDPGRYLRSAVVNAVRKSARRRYTELGALAKIQSLPPAPAQFDETVARRDMVLGALRQLPVRQRAVVILRYLEDYSEKETARILNMRPGTVKAHVSRGTARLTHLLSLEEPVES